MFRILHRNENLFRRSVWVLGVLLGSHFLAHAQGAREIDRSKHSAYEEEIYVARSVREARVAATEFCAKSKTGFDADFFEDQYTLRSVASSASDGRVVNANVRRIGTGHACFGRTANRAILNFYLDLQLGKTTLRGIGDCRETNSDFPETGIIVWRCFLELSDPLGKYIGGQLTSNTVSSLKALGTETDPPGYVQSSIATIRLWKKRPERQTRR